MNANSYTKLYDMYIYIYLHVHMYYVDWVNHNNPPTWNKVMLG